jgi:hypothetical protein
MTRPYDAQTWEAPESSEAEELLSFAEHEARDAVGEPDFIK